jgi:tRNA-2-methylthio-N6-dimethylallyladenosine synthase
MAYYTKVFGCQMNYSDAERIATILEKYKLKPAASIDEADLVIFVTCGVRQSAEDRVYGQIDNIKKKYPEKKIILTGCLAHRKDVQKRLEKKVNLFFPIKDISKLDNFLYQKKSSTPKPQPTQNSKDSNYRLPITNYLKINPLYKSKYSAFVPIMTGCNNFCAYCVVPYARGREYSRPAEDILKEVRDLVKKGYKEIILLGQNVNSYHSQTQNLKLKSQKKSKLPITNCQLQTINFPKLLKLIEKIPGRFWVTFLTSHPKDMSDELIETITRSEKICEYISLPVQSGDNETLSRMNRRYTVEHYKNLIKKIRSAFERQEPDFCQMTRVGLLSAISTDIIVGFPGETKKQFENTAQLLREMKFDMAYIAQYSPRPQTLAWKMKDDVPKKEKERREKVLTEILKKTALENNKKYIGKIVEVLVDKRFELEEFRATAKKEKVEPWMGKYIAHTRTQKKVIFFSDKKIPIGSFQKVKITKAKAFGLEGEIL